MDETKGRRMPYPTIAIVNSDPALLALLDDLLTETDYTVRTYLTEPTTYPALQELQPDLIILDVGMQASAAGWPLLKLLQFDPTTMHIPVLVSTVDHQFIRDKADFLATKGYRVLELPASFATLASVVHDILAPTVDALQPPDGTADEGSPDSMDLLVRMRPAVVGGVVASRRHAGSTLLN